MSENIPMGEIFSFLGAHVDHAMNMWNSVSTVTSKEGTKAPSSQHLFDSKFD